MISRVTSGGQSGVDQAALRAAKASGLETGGWAALGWMTEDGPAPWLADYGLVECPEPGYAARRRRNVLDAHVLLLFGDKNSKGALGLMRDWESVGRHKPMLWVEPGIETPRGITKYLRSLETGRNKPSVLFVAGNRESGWPGIGERTERFLIAVFRQLARG
jgi:hypothetical protein